VNPLAGKPTKHPFSIFKQEFVGDEEGPVGQHPRKTMAHETG